MVSIMNRRIHQIYYQQTGIKKNQDLEHPKYFSDSKNRKNEITIITIIRINMNKNSHHNYNKHSLFKARKKSQ